ncbi:MAG: PQQ-binding-like beta-propeller repeat protein [Deltaproteobacteria bacterium]|nr:PQQ-binding-like beta-propeller repeat protein [Deltaproteobacteria bacterium]
MRAGGAALALAAATLVAVLAVALAAPAAGAASPAARQVYGLAWRKPVIETGPCFLSLFLPPSEAERCTSWTRRETAGPAFHAATGLVLVGGSDRTLRGLQSGSGRVQWQVALPGALVARPLLHDDGAYFGTDDGHVLRTDVTSGRTRWDITVDAEVTEPVVIDDDLVLVVTGNDSLYALKRETGEAAWVHKHPLPRAITLRGQGAPLVISVPTPAGPKRQVLIGHASGRLTILERDTGTVIDELGLSGDDSFGDLDADPFVQRGHVVVASASRGVIALDVKSHAEVWRAPEPGVVRLARGGNHLVIGAGPGKVVALDAITGAPRWRFTFDKGAPSRLVVKGGRVHVASDRGSVYVLDLFTGRPLQYLGSGLGVAADLELSNDAMFVTTAAGEVLALSNAFSGIAHAKR